MAMKSDVEVITGFIGSGKTSFLNALIEGTLHKDERIVIIFLESGETELDERLMKHNQIKKIGYFIDNEFTENELKKILRIYNPHKVFIEFNGTGNINELLKIINCKEIKPLCKITTIYYVTEAVTLELYLNNMGNILVPCVQLSNLVLLNNTKELSANEVDKLKGIIEKYNPYVNILEVNEMAEMKGIVDESNLFHRGLLKKWDMFFKGIFEKL
jgi:G3E family GTPase